jgi:hypothetical protein
MTQAARDAAQAKVGARGGAARPGYYSGADGKPLLQDAK